MAKRKYKRLHYEDRQTIALAKILALLGIKERQKQRTGA